jgi:23S rRNA (uridine2552-2'-O)-methyltransferase
LDVGAAPGGWSQVAAQKVKPGGRVIAIDILQVAPINGVKVLKGDFRDPGVLEALGSEAADAILCDAAPNFSGIPLTDQARQLELSLAAIEFCCRALKPEGVFVVKAFHGGAFDDLVAALKRAFSTVRVIKPTASRGESAEIYVVSRRLSGVGKSA